MASTFSYNSPKNFKAVLARDIGSYASAPTWGSGKREWFNTTNGTLNDMPAEHLPFAMSLRQVTFDAVNEDVTTNSSAFSDLISKTFLATGGGALIHCSIAYSSNPTGAVAFRLTVDGVTQYGFATGILSPNTGGIDWVQELTAGPHTIVLQWRVINPATTLSIRPVTQVGQEGATMLIVEMGTF